MVSLASGLFQWAQVADQSRKTEELVVDPHTLVDGGFELENETMMLGTVSTIIPKLRWFIRKIAQRVLDGGELGGVDLAKYEWSYIDLFTQLLTHVPDSAYEPYDDPQPVIAWVSPVTFTLANRVQASVRSIEGTQFDLNQHEISVPIPKASKPIYPTELPWADKQNGKLALISKQYTGSRLLMEKQYCIAPMQRCDEHLDYYQRNDLVPSHDGFLRNDRQGRQSHSLHPFIAVGRLRPYPGLSVPARYESAIFDYLLLVLDAKSRGAVAVSRVSVDFNTWVSKWPKIVEGITKVTNPFHSLDYAHQLVEIADEIESLRSIILSELDLWINYFIVVMDQTKSEAITKCVKSIVRTLLQLIPTFQIHVDLFQVENKVDAVSNLWLINQFISQMDIETAATQYNQLTYLATVLKTGRDDLEFDLDDDF